MAEASAVPSSVSWATIGLTEIPDPAARPLPYLLAAALAIILLYSLHGSKTARNPIPHLNPRRPFELTDARPKKAFVTGSRPMLDAWFRANPDKPVRVIGDTSEVTVLPPHLAHEIRNDSRLSFSRWVAQVCLCLHQCIPLGRGIALGTKSLLSFQACSETNEDLGPRISMPICPALTVSGKVAATRGSSRL